MKKRDLLLGCLLPAVTFLAYYPAWNGLPMWDDAGHLTKPWLRPLSGLLQIWFHPGAVFQYYPLFHSALWLMYHLWGSLPLGYHLSNILLHTAAALLLVVIMRRLRIPGGWLAAFIFALHPIEVETAAWFSELKNTMSAVFCLTAALAYLKFDARRDKRYYFLAALLFLLGLLSKTVIAALPVILLIVFWWQRGRIDLKKDVRPLLPFFLIGLVSGLFTSWVEKKYIIVIDSGEYHLSILERCLIAGRAFWFYLGKLCWPHPLVFIYPRWQVDSGVWWQYLFPAAALALGAALFALRRRWRAPFAVFLFYGIALFPALGFVNVYTFRFSFVSDHYQYLAGIGPIVLVSALAARFIRPGFRFAKPVLAGLLLALLGFMTWKQSTLYVNFDVMQREIIRSNPTCAIVYSNLGSDLLRQGKYDQAGEYLKKAMELNWGDGYFNYGLLLKKTGKPAAAEAAFRKALALQPNDPSVYYMLGGILLQTGRNNEAIALYEEATRLFPDNPIPHVELGGLFLKLGLFDSAVAPLREAIRLNPNNLDACISLADVLHREGKGAEALELYRKALEKNPESFDANFGAGMLFLESGQAARAIPCLQEAQRIHPDSSGAFEGNMGLACLQAGQIAPAIDHLQKAVNESPGDAGLIANLACAYYKAGKMRGALTTIRQASSFVHEIRRPADYRSDAGFAEILRVAAR